MSGAGLPLCFFAIAVPLYDKMNMIVQEKGGKPMSRRQRLQNQLDVFLVALKLGLASFGGPTAHLGYFHQEYVVRRKWLDERTYADLIALCQFLPGPASSQTGIGIGVYRAGLAGGILAWLGFTLPSALLMAAFAFAQGGKWLGEGWIHGLKIVAVAVVAHAVLGMGKKLAAGPVRATIAVLAMAAVLLMPAVWTQAAVIVAAGAAGWLLFRQETGLKKPSGQAGGESTGGNQDEAGLSIRLDRSFGIACLVLFFALLVLLPISAVLLDAESLDLADGFYRAGSLVFGGGHVVLPLLEQETVAAGWMERDDFLAGYGLAQAVPGPLFTFAAYLGAWSAGWMGALLATIAIFLPAFLLVLGVLPFWQDLRRHAGMQAALAGVNAAVVGILAAALFTPLWTSAVGKPADFVLASVLFLLLAFWRTPPWIIVVLGAAGGLLL